MSKNIWVRTKNNASYYKIKIKAIQYYVQQYDSIWIFSISNSKPFVDVCIQSFGGFSIILTIVISHQAEMLTLTWKSTLHLKSILEDMVSVGTWIYLWALYFVPLIYISLFASTVLSWWLWLYSRAWSQAGWFLQFHSFSRLLWLFKVFCISIQIVKLFVLVLWRIPLVAW